MSLKIVVPDDFPAAFTGSAAEPRLRALGEVTVHTERGADQEAELIRRIGDAEVVINIRAHARFTDRGPGRLPSASAHLDLGHRAPTTSTSPPAGRAAWR